MFNEKTRQGAYFATMAYLFWGAAPIYFKWVSHVPALEILAHRIVWAVILLAGILTVTRAWQSLRLTRKQILTLLTTAVLLAVNWLIYIVAIVNNNIVEASLGYFINPLVSVLLGMIFLGERLRPLQWVAVSLAACGITYQIIAHGELPLVALALAFSFGIYGLLRKNLNLAAATGLMMETLMVLPLALGFLFWQFSQDKMVFGSTGPGTDLLLIAAGFVTSFPLLCFAAAVTRLSLTASGMFQYMGPTISLMIAVLIYDEPFGIARLITFIFIWVALLIFTVETLNHHRRLARQNHIAAI